MIHRILLTVWITLWIVSAASAATVSASEVLGAIKQVESGGNPFAIRDNTGNRSYFPKSLADAITQAKALLALSHNIDLGLYQINSIHLNTPGLTVDTIFDPAVQASAAAKIFSDFYAQSKAIHGDTDLALWRATGAYNGGNAALYRDNVPYVSRVMAVLGLSPDLGNGGAWAQGAGPSRGQALFRNLTAGLPIPGEWKIGDSLNDATADDTIGNDGQGAGLAQSLAGLIAIFLVAFVVILLGKLGLLWGGVKWLARTITSTAVRQMTKRRSLSP